MAALKPTCDRAAACMRTYVNSVNHGGPATNPENLPIFDVSVNLYYFMVCVITIARTSASIWNLDSPAFPKAWCRCTVHCVEEAKYVRPPSLAKLFSYVFL